MTRTFARRWLLLVALLMCGPACADTYPSRPIQLIVPFPAGGPADVVAHVVAPKLAERLGQSVVIDNRYGVDGIVGTEIVAKAAPDGYTLLLATSAHVLHPGTYRSLPFDTEKDFAPISLLVSAPYVLVVNPGIPVGSVEELIAYAKSHPGRLQYASGGNGGPTQLAFELFKIASGTDFVPVAYGGGAEALNSVVANQTQAMFAPLVVALPLIRAGKIVGLGVSSRNRAAAAPELPAIADTLPGFSATSWYAVLAPAATPSAIVTRLNRELDAIVRLPDVKAGFAEIGGEPVGGPAAILAAVIREEIPRWVRVAKEARVHIE